MYEHLVFDDAEHVPLATFPGMRERTVTISSAGKTFSVTGWKIGWALGAPELVDAVTAGQAVPHLRVRRAVPAGDRAGAGRGRRLGRVAAASTCSAHATGSATGCARSAWTVDPPAGTYFVTTDVRPLGYADGVEFCRDLPERCGVVAIPHQVFYDDPEAGRPYVRWAFCKRDDVLDEALARLARLARLPSPSSSKTGHKQQL